MSELDPVLRQILVGHEAETDHSGPAAVARRQALTAMQQAGALRSAAEQCAAASVLVCSEVTAEVQAAQALALAAMPALARARLLAATAYDRLPDDRSGPIRRPAAESAMSWASRRARVSSRLALTTQCVAVRRYHGASAWNQAHAFRLRLNARACPGVSRACARCS